MLNASDLSYAYPNQETMRFPDVHCAAGEHWLLIGQSGSGKTTLLHLLAGLRTPLNGKVRIGDTDISTISKSTLDKFRGDNIGIVFQQPHFVRSLNVEDNLALVQKLSGKQVDRPFIRSILERLNVAHKVGAMTGELSQGEQQRVAIARALVNKPLVILADEPTSALDDVNTVEVINLLEEAASASDTTLLVVTHDNRLKERFSRQIEL